MTKVVSGYRTAITRKGISKPMRWLYTHKLLKGKVLDYGCGRGIDVGVLAWFMLHGSISGYDPYYYPDQSVLVKGYDTITCHYVLNVVGVREEKKILRRVAQLLTRGGRAYFTVRRDIARGGYTSSKGVHRWVELGKPYREIYSDSATSIYSFKKP